MSKQQIAVIDRLLNIKKTVFEAEKYLQDLDNNHHQAIGIGLLHDAVESLFWAISGTDQSYSFKDKTDFIGKFDILQEKSGSKLDFDRTRLSNLNTIRNGYKHHGILPDSKQAQSIAQVILDNIVKTIKNIFGTEFSSISFSSLIEKNELKTRIESVESEYASAKTSMDYKKILEEIGRIYFDFYERNLAENSFSRILLNQKDKRFCFADKQINDLHLDLLELGIIPFYYHRFKNLVPTYGIDKVENIIVSDKNRVYWNEQNWNSTNVEFTLNWLIDFFLRKQWVYSREKYILEYGGYINIIEPLSDFLTLATYVIDEETIKKEVTMRKGKQYLGFASCIDGEWQDYKKIENGEDTVILIRGDRNEDCSVSAKRDSVKVSQTHVDSHSPEDFLKLLQNLDELLES